MYVYTCKEYRYSVMPKLCVFSSFADPDHSLTRFGSDILRRPDPPGPDIGLNMLQLERMFFVFKLFIIILLISCQILFDHTLDPFFNLRPVHLLPPSHCSGHNSPVHQEPGRVHEEL